MQSIVFSLNLIYKFLYLLLFYLYFCFSLSFFSEKDPVFKLGNLRVTDTDKISQLRNKNTTLRNLKSLILLTYYDDDVHIQTCDEKLLLTTLQGLLSCGFAAKSCTENLRLLIISSCNILLTS